MLSQAPSGAAYFPHVDGLRTIAVGAVLLFHLDRHLLPGGFTGVDVFFVISGYLITTILVRENLGGSFHFSRFYQRRIARILPASLAVIVAVIAASAFTYGSQDFASIGATAAAAALSVANMKFASQGNYFEASPDSQPLLHYWSLSVEEQFYFFLPLAIWIAFRFGRGKRSLQRWFLAATLVSFAVCLVATTSQPTWAFYLLPTRAWELLVGSLVALFSTPDASHPRSPVASRAGALAWGSWLGVVAIAASCVLVTEGPHFPGFAAVLPVAGTAAVLACTAHGSTLHRLLSAHPMIAVGKISYSLYLWHWPIYCLVDFWMCTSGWADRLVLKVIILVPIAVASYFALEVPVRSWMSGPRRTLASFAIAGVAVAGVSVAGVIIRDHFYISTPRSRVASLGVICNSGPGRPLIALVGDSQASVYGASLRDIAEEFGLQLNVLAVNGANPLPPGELYDELLAALEKLHPDVTIFAAAWSRSDCPMPPESLAPKIAEDILGSSGILVLVGEPPSLPLRDFRSWMRETGMSLIDEGLEHRSRRLEANTALASTAGDRIFYVDPPFNDGEGKISLIEHDGALTYHDRTHISSAGVRRIAECFREAIAKSMQRSGSRSLGQHPTQTDVEDGSPR